MAVLIKSYAAGKEKSERMRTGFLNYQLFYITFITFVFLLLVMNIIVLFTSIFERLYKYRFLFFLLYFLSF